MEKGKVLKSKGITKMGTKMVKEGGEKKDTRRYVANRIDANEFLSGAGIGEQRVLHLLEDAELVLVKKPSELVLSEALLADIEEKSVFATVNMFGNETVQSHMKVQYGRQYSFRGALQSYEMIGEMAELNSSVCGFLGLKMKTNSVIATTYPNGTSKLGLHSDADRTLEKGSDVICLSSGGTRTLTFSHKPSRTKWEVMIPENVIYVMRGDLFHAKTKELKHGVLEEKGVCGKRVSVTFRTCI